LAPGSIHDAPMPRRLLALVLSSLVGACAAAPPGRPPPGRPALDSTPPARPAAPTPEAPARDLDQAIEVLDCARARGLVTQLCELSARICALSPADPRCAAAEQTCRDARARLAKACRS